MVGNPLDYLDKEGGGEAGGEAGHGGQAGQEVGREAVEEGGALGQGLGHWDGEGGCQGGEGGGGGGGQLGDEGAGEEGGHQRAGQLLQESRPVPKEVLKDGGRHLLQQVRMSLQQGLQLGRLLHQGSHRRRVTQLGLDEELGQLHQHRNVEAVDELGGDALLPDLHLLALLLGQHPGRLREQLLHSGAVDHRHYQGLRQLLEDGTDRCRREIEEDLGVGEDVLDVLRLGGLEVGHQHFGRNCPQELGVEVAEEVFYGLVRVAVVQLCIVVVLVILVVFGVTAVSLVLGHLHRLLFLHGGHEELRDPLQGVFRQLDPEDGVADELVEDREGEEGEGCGVGDEAPEDAGPEVGHDPGVGPDVGGDASQSGAGLHRFHIAVFHRYFIKIGFKTPFCCSKSEYLGDIFLEMLRKLLSVLADQDTQHWQGKQGQGGGVQDEVLDDRTQFMQECWVFLQLSSKVNALSSVFPLHHIIPGIFILLLQDIHKHSQYRLPDLAGYSPSKLRITDKHPENW